MWDIQCIIYGFFMSGDHSFSLANAGSPPFVAAEAVWFTAEGPYEAIFGQDEPGMLDSLLDALKECLAAGSQREGAANNIVRFNRASQNTVGLSSTQLAFSNARALAAAGAGRG
jgi:hypothetical protein